MIVLLSRTRPGSEVHFGSRPVAAAPDVAPGPPPDRTATCEVAFCLPVYDCKTLRSAPPPPPPSPSQKYLTPLYPSSNRGRNCSPAAAEQPKLNDRLNPNVRRQRWAHERRICLSLLVEENSSGYLSFVVK